MTLVRNPMIRWIWVGGMLVTVSTVVAALPGQLSRRKRVSGMMEPFASEDGRYVASAA
jgi:cytochrome c biogenesis factor